MAGEVAGVCCRWERGEVYCTAEQAPKVIASEKFGIAAQVIGRVEAKEGKAEVVVKSEHGEFTY